MNITEKAQIILDVKILLDNENLLYIKNKEKHDASFQDLIMSKTILKQIQCLHWNHKELRSDADFSLLYELSKLNYENIKKSYNFHCNNLKRNKLLIKDRQRQLSKMVQKND